MDNAILEVVIGLALIYATLSLLAMKLQEVVLGDFFRYRTHVLHDLLLEATGRNSTLKDKILKNPLVYALYAGDEAEQGKVGGRGPTSIPPEIFTRALLVELNGGQAPQSAYKTPSAFLNAKMPVDGGAERIWGTLSALLPGREASWPAFESAIGRWFADIGDRSDGWFQRKAGRWTLVVAFLLALALNVDSFQIVRSLGSDPALRLGLADLAARVDAFRQGEQDGKAPAPAPESLAARPMQQLGSRMTDAITRLNDAFLRDRAINDYRPDLSPMKENCDLVFEAPRDTDSERPAGASTPSKVDTAQSTGASTQSKHATAPSKDTTVPSKGAGTPSKEATAPSKGARTPLDENSKLSDSINWVRVLPLLQAKVESAQFEGAPEPSKTYQAAFKCVAQVSSWVRSATVFSRNPSVRDSMQEAAAALESVKSALLALADQQRASASLTRAFITDPQVFQDCSDEAKSRAEFDACLQRELRTVLRLPLLHGGATSREQWCDVKVDEPAAPNVNKVDVIVTIPASGAAFTQTLRASEVEVKPRGTSWFCGHRFDGNPKLGLKPMALVSQGAFSLLIVPGGWIVTMFFVALGAPFWFDLLGKVVKMRSAGTVRDDAADAQRGRGTLPLPPAPPESGRPASAPAGAPGAGPFAAGRNAFEDTLIPADIIRLQQALGVEQTGQIDDTTRRAVRTWCHEHGVTPAADELSATLFLRIVRRPATQAAGSVEGSTRPRAGARHEQVPVLAEALGKVLRMPGRVRTGETVVTDDLRALAVLFRYKDQVASGKAPKDCPVMRLATSNPAALDEIDDALSATILARAAKSRLFNREKPGWMDWAIGELGQVENDATTRAASNERICQYLDKASEGKGNDGDHTPWCGAFVAWALTNHAFEPNEGDANALHVEIARVGNRLLAADWKHWGVERTAPEDPKFGDLVVFPSTGPDSSGHVAFVVAADAHTIWALGGNQQRGSRVSLSAFDRVKGTVVRTLPAPSS